MGGQDDALQEPPTWANEKSKDDKYIISGK